MQKTQKQHKFEDFYFSEQNARRRRLHKRKKKEQLNDSQSGNNCTELRSNQARKGSQQQIQLYEFRYFFLNKSHSQPILIDESKKDQQFIIKIIYRNGDLHKPEKGWIGFYKYDMYLLDGTLIQHKMEDGDKFLLGRNQLQGYEKAFATMSCGQVATIFMTSQYTFKKEGRPPKIPIYSVIRLDVQMVRFQMPSPWQLTQAEKLDQVSFLYEQVCKRFQKVRYLKVQESLKQMQIMRYLIKRAKDILISSHSPKISQMEPKIEKMLHITNLGQLDLQKMENIRQFDFRKYSNQNRSKNLVEHEKEQISAQLGYNFNYTSKLDRKGLFKQQMLAQYQLNNKIRRQNINQWALGSSKIANCQKKIKLGQPLMKKRERRQKRNQRRMRNQQKIKEKQYRQNKLKKQRIFVQTDYSSLEEVSDDSSIDLQDLDQAQIQKRNVRKYEQKLSKLETKMKRDWVGQNQHNTVKSVLENEKQSISYKGDIMSLVLGAIGDSDSPNKALPKLSNQQRFEIYNIK